MLNDDTIVAIATPPGTGALAVIRVSGSGTDAICDLVLQPAKGTFSQQVARALRRVKVVNPCGELLDDATVVRLPAPKTYTGEPMAEIICHGGGATTNVVLSAFLAAGCRAADPGEFSLRAYLNGKMDLATAEAVCDQIRAGTDAAQRLAVRQREGAITHAVEKLRVEIIGLLAAAEVTIDFSDEVGELDRVAFGKQLAAVIQEAEALIQSSRAGRLLREGARLAIVGRPNVGKSSLLNALLGAERAIVTPHAGTTRDTIEETAQVSGIPITFVDTAGLRETDDPVEQIGVQRTRDTLSSADLVLHLYDLSVGWKQEDTDIANRMPEVPFITVANKVDLVTEAQRSKRPTEIDKTGGSNPKPVEARHIMLSAKTGEGLDELRDAIVESWGCTTVSTDQLVLSRARHVQAMQDTLSALVTVQQSLEAGMVPDFLTIDLRGALSALGQITGETTTEEVVHRIFHDFCVGK